MNVLVVDGYNIIGDWDELKKLKDIEIGQARDRLIEKMAEYQSYTGQRVLIVFDAYFVKGKESKLEEYKVEVIYTKEQETADECIERLVSDLKTIENQVYVATSDFVEQSTIFSKGALRKSARELQIELKGIESEITESIEQYNKVKPQLRIPLKKSILETFEKWRRGEK